VGGKKSGVAAGIVVVSKTSRVKKKGVGGGKIASKGYEDGRTISLEETQRLRLARNICPIYAGVNK